MGTVFCCMLVAPAGVVLGLGNYWIRERVAAHRRRARSTD